MLHRIGTALAVLLMLICLSPQAWAEFRVNTTAPGDQTSPSTAALSNGQFVVVWTSRKNRLGVGPDGIFGQMFKTNGGRLGPEFQAHTRTGTGFHFGPSVAALEKGGFLVVWTSDGLDGDQGGIFGRFFDNTGAPEGFQFRVNTTSTGNQEAPSVTGIKGGGFVVTWTSRQDGQFEDVLGQRYTFEGVPVGDEFVVNTTTEGRQRSSSVTGLKRGGFVVVWEDETTTDVVGQLFRSNGKRVGGEFVLNHTLVGNQYSPSVAALANGGFVVVWESSVDEVDNFADVFGQRYNAAAARVGQQFRVNTTKPDLQVSPKVAGLSNGGFVVAWYFEDQEFFLGFQQGQRFSAAGARVGPQFRVGTTTSPAGRSVAPLSTGGFVVTWNRFNGPDDNSFLNNEFDIFAQRFIH